MFYWDDYDLIIDEWIMGYDEYEIAYWYGYDLDYVYDCVDYYLGYRGIE